MSSTTENYYLEPVDFNPFASPEIELTTPLAKPQEDIWLSCTFGGDDASRCYNESVSLWLTGQLDTAILERALQGVVNRHQSLRSVFANDGTQILVYKDLFFDLSFNDLSSKTASEKQEIIDIYLHQDALKTYDLNNGPLFRSNLFKLSENEHHFTFSAHHIVCDGWSLGILLQDLSRFYTAYQQGLEPQLPDAPQMSLYIAEQAAFEKSADYQKTEQYWLNQFGKTVPELALPFDFKLPVTRTYKSRRDDFLMDGQITAALKKTGAKAGASFVTTLLSVFEILLHKITGQHEVTTGLPASGQANSGHYSLTGHCVNLLPLKSNLEEAATFNSYLKQRKSEILDSLDHQQISLGNLLELLHFPRNSSRIPLIPVVFNMDMNMDDGVRFDNLKHRLSYNPRAYETFEIFLNASGSEQNLMLEWSYNSQLFKPETIKQLMLDLEDLSQMLTQEPERLISSISLQSESVLNETQQQYNQTQTDYPQISLPEMISLSLEKHAVKTAITFFGETISNGELLSKSNQLASALISEGMAKGDLVGIMLDRSISMVIALLAVLKTGAAYVPIDPTYPQERINFMMQDTKAKFLLVDQQTEHDFTGIKEVSVTDLLAKLNSFSAENPKVEISGSDLAYVLYTSGSTGFPKGVQVEHHNVVNLLNSICKWPGIAPEDKMLAISTISFDIAGLELFLPLVSGAEIILADTNTAKDGFELLKLIENAGVSLMQATPATFRMLLDAGWNKKMPFRIFCCGEALKLDLAKNLIELSAGVWNMYGPTETTIYSTGKQVFAEDELMTIGKPIDNTQIYILNEQFKPVKDGGTGEIYIGGEGVARGYLNQPELTSLRFPYNQLKNLTDKKIYRTGDIGRILPNGEIEYLGRSDHQIKIRGYRVELGEIEAQLLCLENIDQALVTLREDEPGNPQIVAYVIAPQIKQRKEKQWNKEWKTALKEVLPAFMIPVQIVVLTEFPLTPNQKIDRIALPKPNAQSINTFDYQAPRTDVEKLVADIWCQAMGLDKISIYDNFFEIGGHSLKAVQIMSRLEKETGKRLPLASFFEHPTIESLSLLLQMDGKSITWDSLVPIRPNGNKAPLYIVHGAGLNVLLFNTLAKHMDPDQPVYGLQAKGLNGVDKPLDNLEDIAAHYVQEVIKNNPDGPYALAGYSFGGTIAYEMAKQLQSINKEVKMVALFDSYADQTLRIYPFFIRWTKIIWAQLCNFGYTFVLFFENPASTFQYKMMMIGRKFQSLYWKIKPGKAEKQIGFFGYSHEIDKLNQKAADNYLLTPYNGAVDLFRAKNRTYYMADPKYLGWRKYALKGVRVHEIPGEHNYIFAPPNDEVFAAVLQDCLDKSV